MVVFCVLQMGEIWNTKVSVLKVFEGPPKNHVLSCDGIYDDKSVWTS